MAVERIIAVFWDGVGLGNDDPAANPFVRHPMPFLQTLLDGHSPLKAASGLSNGSVSLLGLDATLSVPGLPQSGTGQTAILTGLNAAAHLGEHSGPYPTAALKTLLAENNLFSQLLARNQPVAFAGAYPDRFLARLQRGTERLSANTRAALLAGLKLRSGADLQAKRAVSALLTNRYWQEWGYDVPLLSPQQAGSQLANLAADHALTFFEMWYTDVVGHKQDMARAGELLTMLDRFLEGLAAAIDPANTMLLVISDHGNLEDLSTKQHTRNPALALAFGAEHHRLMGLSSLVDVAGFVGDVLGKVGDW